MGRIDELFNMEVYLCVFEVLRRLHAGQLSIHTRNGLRLNGLAEPGIFRAADISEIRSAHAGTTAEYRPGQQRKLIFLYAQV